MNEHFATQTQKRRRIIVESQRLISGRAKIVSRKADGQPGTTSVPDPFRMDGWMIEIIGFN